MLKQYVFIPRNMKTGKACSQVAHATFLALENQKVHDYKFKLHDYKIKRVYDNLVDAWRVTGMCVIVLEVEHWQRLRDVEKYCKDWKIIHHLYNDESEALKPTCLATGIIRDEDQWMFSKFKLHGGGRNE